MAADRARNRISALAVAALGALLALTGCASSGKPGTPGSTTSPPASAKPSGGTGSSGGAGSGSAQPEALMIRCVDIPSAQASKILGLPGPFGVSDAPKFPCPAFWTSPVKWEQREGPDSLHGTPSDASVSATYVDFPDSARAGAEFAAIHAAAVKGQVDKFGVKRWKVIELTATGDAEAYLDLPENEFLNVENSSELAFMLIGRCGGRLLHLEASKNTFYSAIMAGHSPSEENIVHRGRTPLDVESNLRAAYTELGKALCAGEDLPSIAVGPYQPVSH